MDFSFDCLKREPENAPEFSMKKEASDIEKK